MSILHAIPITNTSLNDPDWYEQDVWLYSNLGLDGHQQSDKAISFSFKSIIQQWLKQIAKKYILQVACTKTCHFIRQFVSTMGSLSEFLESSSSHEYIRSIEEIDRKLITGYIMYLSKKDYSIATRHVRLVVLSHFFDMCHALKWVNISGKLIYSDDIPRNTSKIPRFIPDSVTDQLDNCMHYLDPHVRRIILVLRETGMRISELVKLTYHCIMQDKDGDYFLKYHLSKMNKEHIIPISQDLTQTIKEQQVAVKKEWGQHDLLFAKPTFIKHKNKKIRKRKTRERGCKWSREDLSRYLKRFARENNIVGPDGKIWVFHFHAFRHTVATNMINHQVPQHVVQRFLGHESPTMTARYAHIFDETLKKAFAEFRGKIVSISGEAVTTEQIALDMAKGTNPNDIDARWLKRNIMAQALPNGTCALPVISKKCPHANACLTCVNFRTDHRYLETHKSQLEKTKAIVDQAKQNGWQRQLEMNQAIQTNLEKIVSTLETV